MTPETKFKRLVRDWLIARNAMVFPNVVGPRSTPSWPDTYVHHTRWQGWIECKAGNNQPSPAQLEVLSRLNARKPGSAILLWDNQDWALILESLINPN